MPVPCRVQIAETTDVEALIVPHRASMEVAYAGYFSTPFPSDETLRDEWRTLQAAGATTPLALCAGNPAGVIAWQLIDGEGLLSRLYVHPGYQGQGIGRALHDSALRSLAALGCRRANLWVLAVNEPAIGIYQHWGWRHVPDAPRAPFGLPERHFVRDLPVAGRTRLG